MYVYALAVVVLTIVGSESLSVSWLKLTQVPPLLQIAQIGTAGTMLARSLAVIAIYCLAFVLLSAVLAIVGSLQDDPDLLRRVAEWPAWWANGYRADLVGRGLRPYAWFAMAAPVIAFQIATYFRGGRLERSGELVALMLLAAIAAAQSLHPFRWNVSFFPSLPAFMSRVGGLTSQRAPRGVQERPAPPAPPEPPPPIEEEWEDWFSLVARNEA